MQIKGNSEVIPKFWPADEFANFENAESLQTFSGRTFRKDNFVAGLSSRPGLPVEARANPFQYGFTGGTDNHNGLPADVVEDNYIGSHGGADKTVELRRSGEIDGCSRPRREPRLACGGMGDPEYARRDLGRNVRKGELRHVGTRIRCGSSAAPTFPRRPTPGHWWNRLQSGVPMGGTLKALSRAPAFTVWAAKDPDGANLDRIQIVKAGGREWRTAGQGDRRRMERRSQAGQDGKLPRVGNTVDVKAATYSNSVGPSSCWAAGAIRNSTRTGRRSITSACWKSDPRWTTFDAVRNNLPLLGTCPPPCRSAPGPRRSGTRPEARRAITHRQSRRSAWPGRSDAREGSAAETLTQEERKDMTHRAESPTASLRRRTVLA